MLPAGIPHDIFTLHERRIGSRGVLRRFIESHPLGLIMVLAIALRTLAVIFSKGFMASDDHFDTVRIAYYWLEQGIFGEDGYLTWAGRPGPEFTRFPLYVFTQYLVMWFNRVLGVDSLDHMMYSVRALHATLSLIAVWSVYAVIRRVSGSWKWAALGGLVMAAHFGLPFLSVRNLIEMVGGNLWIVALYCLYRYRDNPQDKWLLFAGIISGLGWMIRFQLLLAFLPVPLVLWYERRSLRPVFIYAAALCGMILLAGLVEWPLLGVPFTSAYNHLATGTQPMYNTSALIYVVVILGYFIPPLSLLLFFLAAKPSFVRQHRILVFTSLSFVLIHSVLAARQERYMIPIVPALVLLVILALWHQRTIRGDFGIKRALFAGMVVFTIVVNAALLAAFTMNYSHKGLVEPLVRIDEIYRSGKPVVLFVSPEKGRLYPTDYADLVRHQQVYVKKWEDLGAIADSRDGFARIDVALVYPEHDEDLSRYVDSLSDHLGPLRVLFTVEPSTVDRVLHALNPRYNPTNRSWVYTVGHRDRRPGR